MSGQIEYIHTFLEVVEQGGFAAAGRALGLSPTIVTRHIADLEAKLGVQLFTRTTRKVSLTDAGRLYHTQVMPVVSALNAANAAVRTRQVGLSGPLKVSAPMSFGTRVLPDIIAQFRTLHPGVQLDLQLTDRFVDIAAEGFDLALRISEPPTDQTTIWRKICSIPRVIVGAPSYLDLHDPITDPAGLPRHQSLHYAHQKGSAVWVLHQKDDKRRVRLDPCFIGNNGDLISELAVRGEGLALLPLFLVESHVTSGRLRTVLPGWHAPDIWLTTTFPPYDRLTAKVETFTKFVEAEMRTNNPAI
ncbi:LysR family transcriptional regulator [Roseobacter weihaiensis]|uniref:LysR family transcriptional regulator n=1 Tax=Roseobacter weihaiensis TaxID=2763262 RepID=UPI001D0A78EC|nr:LysR family transcriptional regulator [Roseobacter sp. H9]